MRISKILIIALFLSTLLLMGCSKTDKAVDTQPEPAETVDTLDTIDNAQPVPVPDREPTEEELIEELRDALEKERLKMEGLETE